MCDTCEKAAIKVAKSQTKKALRARVELLEELLSHAYLSFQAHRGGDCHPSEGVHSDKCLEDKAWYEQVKKALYI